ncbi:MAG: hypothetical protein M3T96_03695 [Acidobacteriota bacterium]|nr:hypothetical protein [Acidobacteriota bacterium]
MSKKKRQNQTPSVKPEIVENTKSRKSAPGKSKYVIFGIVGLLIVGAAIYFYKNSASKRTLKPFGAVLACQQIPPFVRQLGFGNQVALSTSDRILQGLILVEGERKYQHPSWKSAGSLAPLQRDANGNVFAAPAPWIDTLENKPNEQNKVYRVDGNTQEMKEFAALPIIKTPTAENPFGVLGLTFDCDTNSLYAATVAGSTRTEINGAIYQIDAKTGKILSQREAVDAIGLGVFNSARGKRLYYGAARNSEVWSIDLNDDGTFTGDARREVSFENIGARGDDKARRINFAPNAQGFEMVVYGIEFGFNLIAPTEKQETIYRFRYDLSKDAWTYLPEMPMLVPNQ